MIDLQHTTDISESAATEVIFTACRANEQRQAKTVAGWEVSFIELLNGRHLAYVRAPNKAHTLVATAVVDCFDR